MTTIMQKNDVYHAGNQAEAARDTMGHSQAQKAQNRKRLLEIAAKRIRADGLASLSIGRLMERAGLTHGGFYGHFPTRDALLEAALKQAMDEGEANMRGASKAQRSDPVNALIRAYLSRAHRDARDRGCAIAALIGDVARADDGLRKQMAQKMQSYTEELANDFATPNEDAAWGAWAAMIGALLLARLFADDPRSDRILAAGRKAAHAALGQD